MITNEEQERRFKVNEGGLHLLPTILSITLSWFLGTACSGEPVSSAEDAGAMDASHRADAEVLPSCVETGACVTILESGIYSAAGRSWPYDLLRLGKADGSFAYAMWLPPANQATGPAVLIAAPYAGIDWSGENVDTQWAASAGHLLRRNPV